MDKLSNEISFSNDSPQQVGPVRGSGTSATSHLLLANRINVRAYHVRSSVAMQLNTKCQHKHQQGVLQGCFYTAYGVGWCPAAFSSVIGFGRCDTRRRDTCVDPTPRTNQTPVGGGKRSPGRWQPDRVVGRQTGLLGQTDSGCRLSKVVWCATRS
jgi:hypothetical protein